MKRTLSRVLTLAVALPLAIGAVSGSAHAEEIAKLPGCWGGVTPAAIVCNLTITAGVPYDVETYQTSVPVCAGTCQNVPVTLARTKPGEPLSVCYSYTNGAGVPVSNCVDQNDVNPLVDTAIELAQLVAQTVVDAINELPEDVQDAVCWRLERYDIYC